MKYLRFSFILLALLCSSGVNAHTEAWDTVCAVNAQGIPLYYKFVREDTDGLDIFTYASTRDSTTTVEVIRNGMFYLKNEIAVPSSIEHDGKTYEVIGIGDHAFAYSVLTAIHFPPTLRYVSSRAFMNCPNLTSVTLPETVTAIGYSAFYGCNSLTSITIPDGVDTIAVAAFRYCTALREIRLPDSLRYIETTLLADCSSLEDVYIPDNVTFIGSNAFMNCTSLKSIVIPRNVRRLNNWVFVNCTALEEVSIPDSLVEIQKYSFENCSSLKTISFSPKMRGIKEGLLKDCVSLTEARLPDTAFIIGWQSFRNCRSLVSFNIPQLTGPIYLSAFENCHSLAIPFILQEGLDHVNSRTFYGCYSMPSVTIASTISYINDSAFAKTRLNEVVTLATSPPEVGVPSISDESRAIGTLYVPQGTANLYRSREAWRFANIVEGIPTDIKALHFDDKIGAEYYTLDGKRLAVPQHGINIVRLRNGTVRKVWVEKHQ